MSGVEGLDQLLTDTRRVLGSLRSGGSAAPDVPVESTGVAFEEQVRATVARPGRLTGLDLGSRALRLPAEDLSAHIIAAVNSALDGLAGTESDAATPVDMAALSDTLADLHGESIRQMARFTSTMRDAVAQIQARGE
jgi:hypothetical protein